MTESTIDSDTTERARHRLVRQVAAALAAAAATGGFLVWLRRRSQHPGTAAVAADPAVLLDGPDGMEPDVIHAPGHRHRATDPIPTIRPVTEEHPPEPTDRHRDRGGRSAAFHTQRST